VIAADEDVSQRLCFGNDFVGIAAVADRVPEIDDKVIGGSGSQTGVQRFEVTVNIAEKKDAHGKGRIIASLERIRRGGEGDGGTRRRLRSFPDSYWRIASQLAEKTGAALAFGWRSGLPLR
jgi:hypothetical protein